MIREVDYLLEDTKFDFVRTLNNSKSERIEEGRMHSNTTLEGRTVSITPC